MAESLQKALAALTPERIQAAINSLDEFGVFESYEDRPWADVRDELVHDVPSTQRELDLEWMDELTLKIHFAAQRPNHGWSPEQERAVEAGAQMAVLVLWRLIHEEAGAAWPPPWKPEFGGPGPEEWADLYNPLPPMRIEPGDAAS